MNRTCQVLFRPLTAWALVLSWFTAAGFSQDGAADEPYVAGTAQPWNIVLVLTDDQPFDLFGASKAYPFLEGQTPHLDRLAEQGIRFENTFATTSLCSPSRASILTGMYMHRHLVYHNLLSRDPAPDLPQFPALLQQAGYETAFVGKWHMKKTSEIRPGFDHWYSFRSQGKYFDPRINDNGNQTKTEGYVTDILTDRAVRWLKEPREKPFCLMVSHKAVHAPFEPALRHRARFAEILSAYRQGIRPEVGLVSATKTPRPSFTIGQVEAILDQARCLLAVDESLGRILQVLEDEQLLGNTAVLFTSDNGLLWARGGVTRSKRVMLEDSIRIPLLALTPTSGAAERRVVSDMILNVDFAPTFLDLAGVKQMPDFHGRSFATALRGQPLENWRESFLYEYFNKEHPPQPSILGVRTKTHKLILNVDTDEPNRLHDLLKDPGERINFFNVEKHSETREELQSELLRLQEELDFKVFQKREPKKDRDDSGTQERRRQPVNAAARKLPGRACRTGVAHRYPGKAVAGCPRSQRPGIANQAARDSQP